MLSPILLLDDLSELSREQLDHAPVELCAHINAAEYRLPEFVGEGDFRFARADGTALPQVIEPEGGVWTDVAELNERRGLAIDEGTCAGGWDGSPIDYGEAIARIQQATEPPRLAPGP